MKKIIKHRKAIQGKFAHILPNKDIRLSQEEVTLNFQDGRRIKAKGVLYLELMPSFNFAIKVKLSYDTNNPLSPLFEFNGIDLRTNRAPNSNWIITNNKPRYTSKKFSIALVAKAARSNIELPSANNLLYATFHVTNFPDFRGLPIEYPSGTTAHGRLELIGGGWKIKIDSTPYTEKNISFLKKSSGYSITHVGKLERVNRKIFSSQEATELATNLMYFLSFANGMWVNPILFSGYDIKKDEVWQGWLVHHSRPWKKPSLSWHDSLHTTEILPPVFDEFIQILNNPTWTEVIKHIIYWYVQTNISNVDSGLILGQTALELLTWNYLVIDKKILSRNKFRNNSTADNLRTLLLRCGIPTAIPSTNQELANFANPGEDGPDIIVRVRNDLVHPEKRNAGKKVPYFYLLNLQQWYIELILLRIFNYHGNYHNRLNQNLWAGNIEPVPWK